MRPGHAPSAAVHDARLTRERHSCRASWIPQATFVAAAFAQHLGFGTDAFPTGHRAPVSVSLRE